MDDFITAYGSGIAEVFRLAVLFMLGWYLGALAAISKKEKK